jgi:hypothetical protein
MLDIKKARNKKIRAFSNELLYAFILLLAHHGAFPGADLAFAGACKELVGNRL